MLEKAALEADYVARRIRALIDGGAPVWENGAERPAHYGDVVILLRSANSVGPVYRAALEAHGIPVSAETSGGFYTSEEVSVLRSLLGREVQFRHPARLLSGCSRPCRPGAS